jgi:hypothetical protein
MTASSTAPPADDVLAAAATSAQRPDAKHLAQALLLSEKAAKGKPLDLQALEGTWRLRFTVPSKPRLKDGQSTQRGFYIPRLVQAEIGFQAQATPTPLAIHNQLSAGPLQIRFTGNAKPVAKNLVAFEFTRLQLQLAGITLYQGTISTSPLPQENRTDKAAFFAFFATAQDYIAARGRGGGLALWVRSA